MKNGIIWQDIDGNDIQAHGGCIIKHGDMYYWYGEHKGIDNTPRGSHNDPADRVDVVGVSCYSSPDLLNWKYEGLALSAVKDDPESPLHPSKVCERPKVIYNEKTENFVMWMHLDSQNRRFAGVGIAVSKTPQGPFELLEAKRPLRVDSRDFTIYKDQRGEVWLLTSSHSNRSMMVARLTEDYTDLDGFHVFVLVDQVREAPALCFHNNMYYMISSGCTGWNPNSALYATSAFVPGNWKLIDNPCEGHADYRQTFGGQSAYIFEKDGKFWLMLDHWQRYNLKKSGYSILPITFDDRGQMTVTWTDEWTGA